MAKKKSSLVDYLLDRYVGDDPERQAEFEEVCAGAEVARQIHALRKEAGFTQRKLAELVGTQHSVICRLEDDDYQGHSLSMLRRIASAFGKRIEIRFVPESDRNST